MNKYVTGQGFWRLALWAMGTGLVLLCAGRTALAEEPVHTVSVELGAYIESGQVDDEYRVSVQDRSDSYDYDNDSVLSIGVGYLWKWFPSIRVGGQVRYFGTYSVQRLLEDDAPEDAEEPSAFAMGPLIEWVGQAEWRVPIVDQSWSLALGGQLGLATLFPAQDLERQIEALQQEGVDISSAPRLGYVFGARAGAVYPLSKRFAVRADYSAQGTQIFLYDTDEEVFGVAVRRKTNFGALRHNFTAGLEVFF